MNETFICHDGREAQLHLDDDEVLVTVANAETHGDAQIVGRFKYGLIDRDAQPLCLLEEAVEGVTMKLLEESLDPDWADQGIRERVLRVIEDETALRLVKQLRRVGTMSGDALRLVTGHGVGPDDAPPYRLSAIGFDVTEGGLAVMAIEYCWTPPFQQSQAQLTLLMSADQIARIADRMTELARLMTKPAGNTQAFGRPASEFKIHFEPGDNFGVG